MSNHQEEQSLLSISSEAPDVDEVCCSVEAGELPSVPPLKPDFCARQFMKLRWLLVTQKKVVNKNEVHADQFSIWIYCGTVFLVHVLMGATVFRAVCPGWSFFESVWFVIVTLTTVGYGDFTANYSAVSMVATVLFVWMSLFVLTLCLGLLATNDENREEALTSSADETETEETKTNEALRVTLRKVGILLFLVLLGTITFPLLEGWTWTEGFYFSSVTLVSVGYGDFVPTHISSRLIAIPFILYGVINTPMLAGSVVDVFLSDYQQRKRNQFIEQALTYQKIVAMAKRTDEAQRKPVEQITVDEINFLVYMLTETGLVEMEEITHIRKIFKKLDADGSGELSISDIAKRQEILGLSIQRTKRNTVNSSVNASVPTS